MLQPSLTTGKKNDELTCYNLVTWKYTLQKKGDTRSWPTIRGLLRTHAYTTIILPTQDGRMSHLRIPGQPEAEQVRIYDLLGIKYRQLPRRHQNFS